MRCVVPGPNVKVLGRAIHSLAKLGDELYLESSPKDLSFRTVNMSKTAYASFTFGTNFFSFFNDAGLVKLQISMKASLSVFRSPITLEKTVESCQIKIQDNTDKLIFIMKYKRGVIKTFYVPIIECETLEAYYRKDKAYNCLKIQSKTVNDILSNFKHSQDEITWVVSKKNVVMRNYFDEDGPSGVRTDICVERDEFDEFQIQTPTDITFCLKELRAVLLFSESVGLPLVANFSIPSKPIVFVISNEVFEAHVVVSTLNVSEGSSQSQRNTQNTLNCQSLQANSINVENEDVQLSVNMFEDENAAVNLHPVINTNPDKQKLKHVFQRCFEKEPFDLNTVPGYENILMAESDTE